MEGFKMEHLKFLSEFLTRKELEFELFTALMMDNHEMAKLINDEIFERTLAEYENGEK